MLLFRTIKLFLITLLLTLAAISYHPLFFSTLSVTSENSERNTLSRYIMLVAVFSFILTFRISEILKNKTIIKILVLLGFALIQGFLILALFNSNAYLYDIRSVFMAVVFLFIGYCSKLNQKEFIIISLISTIAIVYSLYAQVRINIGGFIILNQYFANAKNALGVIGACATIFVFYLSFTNNIKNIFFKFSLWASAAFLLLLILTIRARASTLSIIAFLLYYILIRTKNNRTTIIKFIIAIFVFVLLIYVLGIADEIYNYFIQSFVQNREGDITSERNVRNADAIDIFMSEPLWGQLVDNSKNIEWVHNYLLRIISSYGILGSLFILFLYMYIAFYVIKKTLNANVYKLEYIGFFIIIAPLVSSLAEPTFPYSPGTSIVFAFFAFGYSMNSISQEKQTKINIKQ